MTTEPRRTPNAVDVIGLGVGLAGAAAAITMMYLAMGAVMGVGGMCASGGPYVIATQCPSGAPAGMLIGIFLLLVSWFVAAMFGPRVGGFWSSAAVLGWAALFIALGWNFLASGFSGKDGGGLTAILLGIMFWVMGAVPLIYTLGVNARGGGGSSFLTGSPRRPAAPSASLVEMQADPSTPEAGADPASEAPLDTAALSAHLERLADLHAKGELDDAEFTAAKASILKALEGIK
jgi:hypothetical protein